jgi:hypothetical protein
MTESRRDVQPRGYSLVARRLAGWTSNLLVSAVVLVVGLTFGRLLTSWWAWEGQAGASPALAYRLTDSGTLGNADSPHQVEFGELPVRLGRQIVEGDTQTVLAALRDRCRVVAGQGGQAPRVPGPEETKMLQGMVDLQPVEQLPGKWRMYQLERPIPLVAVTDARTPAAGHEGQSLGHVLCWGLAFPAGTGLNEWTLLTVSPTGGSSRSPTDPLTMALPAGAQRQMQVQSENGGGMLLFRGTGVAEAWWSVIDGWFQQHGWSQWDVGTSDEGRRYRRYVSTAAGSEAEVCMEFQEELRVLLTVNRH